MNRDRISHLLDVHQNQTATDLEKQELDNLLLNHQYNEIFEALLDEQWIAMREESLERVEFPGQAAVLQSIKQEIGAKSKSKSVGFIRIVAAAAVMLMVLSVGFYFHRYFSKPDEIYFNNDVAPGKNGATLTLGNGKTIAIDEALTGNIANDAGVKIFKNKAGQIIYQIIDDGSTTSVYNTLTTMRGEQTEVLLPDGTLVFLNAQSSLKFPTNFNGAKQREVMLTGEGYFEVTKNKKQPFVVASNNQQVKVLGTTFNINAYADEPEVKTTLLEGSINITNNITQKSSLILPGQQAVIAANQMEIKTVETDDVVAWKNGYFMFNNETLPSILNKVSKWYDVEVIYKDDSMKNKTFFGAISRYKNISELLKVMQKTDVATFEIKGRQIIVSAKN